MQIAAGMLTSRASSIARIGANVGYESEAAFSRAFKRSTGLSPAAWRAQALSSPTIKTVGKTNPQPANN
jgi:AraC-like DNA-binding protein